MKKPANSKEKVEEYKKELVELFDDLFLKRIILAYSFPDPVSNMEFELSKILQEVLNEENKELND